MSNFRLIDRETGFLMPPSVDEWLPPARHLARFVVEVVSGLDLRAMIGSYRGSGEASSHPALLLGLIIYGYATGVFSSRQLERATSQFGLRSASSPPINIPTMTPSPRSAAAFSGRVEICSFMCLAWPARSKILKLGTVALDGTKIHANASRHSALSAYRREQDRGATEGGGGRSTGAREAADQADIPDGMQVARGVGTAREAAGRDRPRKGGDRGASDGAPCA